jgi:nitrogen fixation NifU-like protein
LSKKLSPEQTDTGFMRHAFSPVFQASLATPNGQATGVGQCGDSVAVSIRVDGETILDIGVAPKGCVYTVACANALASQVRGRSLEDALRLEPEDLERELKSLPEEHRHCALLAVNTLGEAIEDYLRRRAVANRSNVLPEGGDRET